MSASGGRVFFSQASRSLMEEDEIELTSVGVDIGSSTSHLLVSTIVLERSDTRYVVVDRRVRFESEILLTPYAADETIDADALGAFVSAQYAAAGVTPDDIDTGALILTGVAARRSNARAIGDLFSAEAGRFVSLSAGDSLEALMAAQGSGAAAMSASGGSVVNIDIGGGTTKIAVCEAGGVTARTALDVGARLVAFDDDGRLKRLETFGARHLSDAGVSAAIGDTLTQQQRTAMAEAMADRLVETLSGGDPDGLLRLPKLPPVASPMRVVLSGGAAEFLSGAAGPGDDLGRDLIEAVRTRLTAMGAEIVTGGQQIRATVVGASQYTVQVSGSTIFLDPVETVPLRNLAVITPAFDLGREIDADQIAGAVRDSLDWMDLEDGDRPVAVAIPWQGSALYGRLSALGRGLVDGLKPILDTGHPLVLAVDGDIGGLLGMQIRSEEPIENAVVSIDGVALSEFDFIDIGEVIRATGATPVVIKSLLFPNG